MYASVNHSSLLSVGHVNWCHIPRENVLLAIQSFQSSSTYQNKRNILKLTDYNNQKGTNTGFKSMQIDLCDNTPTCINDISIRVTNINSVIHYPICIPPCFGRVGLAPIKCITTVCSVNKHPPIHCQQRAVFSAANKQTDILN